MAETGRFAEAAAAFRYAIKLDANHVGARINLALALVKMERHPEAVTEARAAVALAPKMPEALTILGTALDSVGRPLEALQHLQLALQLRPEASDISTLVAKCLGDLGRQGAATALQRALVARFPDDPHVRSNHLFGLQHIHGDNGPLMLQEHKAWTSRHADVLAAEIRLHDNDRSPGRRLRVAYVSADFRDHPATRFLLPLIEAHDKEQMDLICYIDVPKPDDLTKRFHAAASLWRDTSKLTDEALADQVRADGIDVFVDPTGFMAANRLLTFARQPAPVQISYSGYPGTIAMSTIPWRLTDAHLDPPGQTDRYYTEKLIRVGPSAMVYNPLTETPEVVPTPALRNGFISFGMLNRLSKLTPAMISVWGRVLAAVPRSRLLLISPSAFEPEVNNELRRQFARCGVPPERLELAPRSQRISYLKLFNEIDIQLDTFPYTGCTTTCDGLWMGVPTITLAGSTYVSRMGVSLLTQVGLTNLITATPADYIRTAAELADNVTGLNHLRQSLRDRMTKSPLMDYRSLARNIEAAFRMTWESWCAGS